MYAQVEKANEGKSRAAAKFVTQKMSSNQRRYGIVDNRPEAEIQRRVQLMINNSPTMNTSQVVSINSQAGIPQLGGNKKGGRPIQRFLSHPKSRIPPKINIDTEEANGGHTLDRHVITKQQAMTRVVNEGQVPSSRWQSKSDAENTINSIVKKNWYNIKIWANTQGAGQCPTNLIEDNTKGKVVWEDLLERDSDQARLYLYRNKPGAGDAEVDVRAITSFPEHKAKPSDVGASKRGNIKKSALW